MANLYPGHVVLLHLLHLVLHHRVQLTLELERLKVVHIPINTILIEMYIVCIILIFLIEKSGENKNNQERMQSKNYC